MKMLYMSLLLMLIIAEGCRLFKKTTKTSALQSSAKNRETNSMILKRTGRETQVFTYWNDSGFYQFQNIKEQIDQAKSGSLKAREELQVKQKSKEKKSLQVDLLIYATIIILVTGFILVLIKKNRRAK